MIYRNEDFIYDSETGGMIHARDKSPKTKKFAPCSTKPNAEGYLTVESNNIHIQQHRLAWFLVYGKMPEHELDHIDGNRSNNRIDNLREVSDFEQMKNKKLYKNNKSGLSGVRWSNQFDKWQAYISNNGKRIHLGFFDNLLDACCARKSAEKKYSFHKNHGRQS